MAAMTGTPPTTQELAQQAIQRGNQVAAVQAQVQGLQGAAPQGQQDRRDEWGGLMDRKHTMQEKPMKQASFKEWSETFMDYLE